MLIVNTVKSFRSGTSGAGFGWFSKRRHGAMAKNMAVLGFGTALSQVLNVISTPVLSWYYSPESFGIMATALSIVYIFASLANLNYDASIILPKSKNEATDLLFLCLFLNLISSVLFLFILTVCMQYFNILSIPASPWLYFLLTIGVLLLSTFNSLNYYAVRIEAYTASSVSHVIRTLACLLVQMLGILSSCSALWLIGGRIFGLAPALGYLVKRECSSLLEPRTMPRPTDLIKAAQAYRRFPIFAAPQRIIAILAEEMPTLALATFFGPSAAGYYWFSSRLLQMPCGVISSAIGRVFSREAVKKLHKKQKTFPAAIKIVVVLALLALLPVCAVALWAPHIFDFFLGEQWLTAARYSQWIAIWVFFRFAFSPVLCLFTVLNEQKRLLQLDTFAFFVRIALIAYCALVLDALAVVMMLSIFESVKIAVYGMIVLYLAKFHDKQALTLPSFDQPASPLA